jgi:hypothetical protein
MLKKRLKNITNKKVKEKKSILKMSSNKFIGCNIFFRFIKANKNVFYDSKTVTTVIPISKLNYIEYEHSTNKTSFYFDNCNIEIIPENRKYNCLKDIETQINNGYNIIDIKE